MNAIARIRKFAARRKGAEVCALCGVALGTPHPHLLEAAVGKLRCTCGGCTSVFSHDAGKYRRVPDRVLKLAEFRMTEEQWSAFGVPVGIAYFRKNGEGALGFFPSPLGAVESSVSPEAWGALVRENQLLKTLEPDVEALLVGRAGSRREYFIVPIDACHRLVGILRRDWRGFSGGGRVQESLDGFFSDLRTRADSGGGA